MKNGISYMEMKQIMNQETAEVEVENLPKYVPSLLNYDFMFDFSDIHLKILRLKIYLNNEGLSEFLVKELRFAGYELFDITKNDFSNARYYAIFIRKEEKR